MCIVCAGVRSSLQQTVTLEPRTAGLSHGNTKKHFAPKIHDSWEPAGSKVDVDGRTEEKRVSPNAEATAWHARRHDAKRYTHLQFWRAFITL